MTPKERARRWLASYPPAIEGQGGDQVTYKAAHAAVKGFGLTEEDALEVLTEWNASSVPPWSTHDLREKIRSAAKSQAASGYLLNAAPRRGNFHPTPEPKPPTIKRTSWPQFETPSDSELHQLCETRKGVCFHAALLASKMGKLKMADYKGHRCFILTEGTFAQARRLDGGRLPIQDREEKSLNFPGSQGSWIGRDILGGPMVRVLVVEGAVAFLEGITACWHTDADAAGWTVLAATSAGARFDDDLLQKMQGRCVLVCADDDKAGREAAARWRAELQTVGADVRLMLPPDGCKDLGEWIAADPNPENLKPLFT